MKTLRRYSFVSGGVIAFYALQSLAYATYLMPTDISDMPQQTQAFLSKITYSGSQANYFGGAPNTKRGMSVLENYYENRYDAFMMTLNNNVNILKNTLQPIVSAAARNGDLAHCLDKKSWNDFRSALQHADRLVSYANSNTPGQTAGGGYAGGFERPTLSSDITESYNKIGTYIGLSDNNSSFMQDLTACCSKISSSESKEMEVCDEDSVRKRLAPLDKLEKLPYKFVDPMNPGRYAQHLTPEDIVTLMGIGEMNDFIEAKDFNSQAMALMNADNKCENAKADAFEKVKSTGELHGTIQVGLQSLQCSLGFLLETKRKGLRQIGLGLVRSTPTIYGKQLGCPQEVQDAAALSLGYSANQFRSDFQHLTMLPGNITQSVPVAKPIDIQSIGDDLSLELRDEAGFTKDSIYISAEPSAQYLAQMNLSINGTTNAPLQTVSTTVATTDGQGGRVVSRNLVRGAGEKIGNSERTAVRSLASQAAEGNLDSARSLASATHARKEAMQAVVTKAQSESAQASDRVTARATQARSLATGAIILDGARETGKTFTKSYKAMYRALGLTDPADASTAGRDVERPTGTTTTSTGSTVTSNTPSATDTANNNQYKIDTIRKGLVTIKNSIRTMAEGINNTASRLNDLIKQKTALIETFRETFDPGLRYQELGDLGMDARADKLVSLNETWARMVKEINLVNTQELGLRAVLATSKMSFQNYISGAQAFQGLDVRHGDVRSPASVDPMFAQTTPGQQINGMYAPSPIPNGAILPTNPLLGPTQNSVLSPNQIPPVFNPSLLGPVQGSVFMKMINFFNLPTAEAAPLSRSDKRSILIKEFSAFIRSYNDYTDRLIVDSVAIKQEGWERYILNEREMKKEALLSSESRVIVGSFNDAVREEVVELMKVKTSKSLPANASPQIYQYFEQIRSDSAELNELVAKEAALSLKSKSRNPENDDESWTGMLPAITLQ